MKAKRGSRSIIVTNLLPASSADTVCPSTIVNDPTPRYTQTHVHIHTYRDRDTDVQTHIKTRVRTIVQSYYRIGR